MKTKKNVLLVAFIALCSAVWAQDSIYFRANAYKEQLDRYYGEDTKRFPEKGQILFVGSSSIAMWKNLPSYFPQYKVLARGFGGAWMSDVVYHMQRLVLDYQPKQIVLYAGENDISNGVSPMQVAQDVMVFIRTVELQLPGVPIVVLSIKPSPLLLSKRKSQQEANRLIYDYCQTKQSVKFLDITNLMLNEKGETKVCLYLPDRLHITEEAYCLWSAAIQPLLINNK